MPRKLLKTIFKRIIIRNNELVKIRLPVRLKNHYQIPRWYQKYSMITEYLKIEYNTKLGIPKSLLIIPNWMVAT